MFTAFLDSNVLVPVSLTDTILRAAEKDLFSPCWSPLVLGEVAQVLQRVRPDIPPSRIKARLREMDNRFPRASITRFDHLLADVHLPDENDRHVVAAAVLGGADVIVTRNTKDFPDSVLASWGLESVTPDDFLMDMLDLFPDEMVAVLVEQAGDTRRPSRTLDEILTSLDAVGVPGFVESVRRKIRTDAMEGIRQLRSQLTLGDATIASLRDEGRR